jgi:hypothetical protein
VPLEDRVGVIAKAISESIHFALLDVIHPQFINVVWAIGAAERAEAKHHRDAAKKR